MTQPELPIDPLSKLERAYRIAPRGQKQAALKRLQRERTKMLERELRHSRAQQKAKAA